MRDNPKLLAPTTDTSVGTNRKECIMSNHHDDEDWKGPLVLIVILTLIAVALLLWFPWLHVFFGY